MKKATLLLFLSAVSAFALTPVERRVVEQMKDTIVELRGKLSEAQGANDAALASLSLATTQSVDLTMQARLAAEQAAMLTAERDQLRGDLAVITVKLNKLNAKYQFAQFLVAVTVAAFVGLLCFYLTQGLLAPYKFLIPAGAAGAAYLIVVSIL